MKTKPIQRTLSLISALAMILTVFAVPAFAATPPSSTAKIVSAKDVLARSQAVPFTIEVNYPTVSVIDSLQNGGGKSPVDVVQIVAPAGLITDLQGTTPEWDAVKNANGHLFLVAKEGQELQPGSTKQFTFTADIAAPHEDLASQFRVFLSSDEGRNYTRSTEAAPGDLVTNVRVLDVKSVELTAPGGVIDYTASTDQSNIVARVTVENRGAEAGTGRTGITVQPSLTGAATRAPAAKPIAYDSTETFDFGVTMPADPGTVVLTGGASGTDANATAISENSPDITVLRRVTLTYKSGSLAPRAVIGAAVPTAPSYAFKVGLSNTGQVAADITVAGTEFALSSFKAPLASATPPAIAPDTTELALTFADSKVALPDGEYSPTTVIKGLDENGAPIDTTVNITDRVKVDTDIPVVDAVLNGTASHLSDPDANEAQVTTNGASVSVSGKVTNANGTACGDCRVTSATLQQLTGSLSPVGAPITMNVTVDGQGNLSGSASPAAYDPAARFVRLNISVSDAAGLGSSGSSKDLIVDNIAPNHAMAKTGPAPASVTADRPADRRTITVFQSESVKFDPNTSPTDWKVDGMTVLGARAYRDTGAVSPGHADFVVLSLSGDLAPDQTPRVTYEPVSGLDGNRGHDQVRKPLANQVVDVVDGIVPDLADLFKVNDRQEQDGAFFTNATAPTITFDNIATGHTVKVYEKNADGTRTLIDQGTQANDSGVLTLNKDNKYSFSVASPGGERTIVVDVLDLGGNSSGLAEFDITFDFVAPTLSSITQNGRDLTVTLSEPLSKDPNHQGRDSASDWSARSGTGTFAPTYAATGVTHSGSTVSVTMEQDASTVQLHNASYNFVSGVGSGSRYEDRAGNLLQDFTGTISR